MRPTLEQTSEYQSMAEHQMWTILEAGFKADLDRFRAGRYKSQNKMLRALIEIGFANPDQATTKSYSGDRTRRVAVSINDDQSEMLSNYQQDKSILHTQDALHSLILIGFNIEVQRLNISIGT